MRTTLVVMDWKVAPTSISSITIPVRMIAQYDEYMPPLLTCFMAYAKMLPRKNIPKRMPGYPQAK